MTPRAHRWLVAAILVTSAAVIALNRPASAASKIDGLWDAVIMNGGGQNNPAFEIPFRFEIETTASGAQGFFFEGDRKIGSTSGTFADGVAKFEYDFLNTILELNVDGDGLKGTYRNNRPNARPQEVRMRRFAPVQVGEQNPPQLAGTWEMRRLKEEQTAPRDTRTWHVYLRQSGAEVSGSILRVDGDVGTLVGSWRDGKLTMSHFAGERPNLFEATPNADGTLSVTLNRNAHYLVVRSTEARAKGIPEPPDPSRYTSVKDPTTPFAFSFPDMTGKVVSNTDPAFRGKVVILAIGGSWCPNCHDEAPFLGELYRDYHARGLEIVGLMFENDPNPAVYRPRVASFVKRYNIQYPMLYAGTTNPTPQSKVIAEALPQIVNFGAYPTSIYLGRDGRVRSVHAGFASPATGEEHVRLKKELREVVEHLLAESSQSSAGQR
ncbi:MAG TPA: TlpA disulfide reductase family protein [Vicinamibacterales bacterium]|nr:TlpA disulfide reductase family protein [Vicinamibacterales bacterium]